MEQKKKRMKQNEEDEIDESQAGLLGLGAGTGIGLIPAVKYYTSNEEQRRQWDRDRVAHHGAIGVSIALISLLGFLSNDKRIRKIASFGVGFGTGVALSDIQDADRWYSEGKLFNGNAK